MTIDFSGRMTWVSKISLSDKKLNCVTFDQWLVFLYGSRWSKRNLWRFMILIFFINSLYLKWPGMLMFSDWFKNDFFDIVQLVRGPWLGLFGILVRLTTVLHDDSVRFDSINSGRIPKYSSIGPFFRSLFPNSKSENKNISQYSTERKTHRNQMRNNFSLKVVVLVHWNMTPANQNRRHAWAR